MRARAGSGGRAKVMSEDYPGTGSFIPDSRSLRRLGGSAAGCHGCDVIWSTTDGSCGIASSMSAAGQRKVRRVAGGVVGSVVGPLRRSPG
jgi:hypothetical protein